VIKNNTSLVQRLDKLQMMWHRLFAGTQKDVKCKKCGDYGYRLLY